MEVISLSLGRNILDKKSAEFARMKLYAEHLSAYHVIVLTRKKHGFDEEVHEGALHIYPTGSASRVHMLFAAYRLGKKILKNARDAVVTAQDPLEIGWVSIMLARLHNARFHVQMHGDYFNPAWNENSPRRIFELYCARMLLALAPAIRVVSERIKRSLIARGVPDHKITVLPIRPELERFLEKPYAVKCEPPYTLLSLGRLSPEKDIPRMLAAFAKVREKRADVRLSIVGSGIDEKRIRHDIEKLGVKDLVTLVPWTNDVPYEMARADLFLLTSKHEAYALTLVEAMAAGVPVVTTDVGCVGELVEDGVHGRVVKESGVEPFARAVLELLDAPELRVRYSQNGRTTARKLAETSSLSYARAWVTAVSRAL